MGFYRERLIARDLLFDRDLIALRGQLAAIACSPGSPEDVDAELRAVLIEAMPVYRRHWWPGHHTANTEWIRRRLEELKSHETVLAERLAQAYGGEWPPERIRVDVTAYASWSGAYTTNRPNQVTVSSSSYKGLEGLEILFHEVSHASFFEQRLLGQISAAFREQGAEPPDRLSHVIQFITPPELLRSLLSSEEIDGYRSVAERVYSRGGSLSNEYRIVLEHWKPFLDGEIQRAEALRRIAAELAPQGGGEVRFAPGLLYNREPGSERWVTKGGRDEKEARDAGVRAERGHHGDNGSARSCHRSLRAAVLRSGGDVLHEMLVAVESMCL